MNTEAWRPLGVDTEDDIAEYDALHDGVPRWMAASFVAWLRESITTWRQARGTNGGVAMLNVELTEAMCQALKIPMENLRSDLIDYRVGQDQLDQALDILLPHGNPLQVADYLLAFDGSAEPEKLDLLLERSKSAWRVGTRSGRRGLVRRVPLGVQAAADSIMGRAGRAGVRLAAAWGELYGLNPNPSTVYRLAIQAVEDAMVPIVSPQNKNATLGTVIKQIEDQKNWMLPMDREHPNAPTGEILVGMMRVLWCGQHDRHGGQSTPGNVSMDEATVAVSLAVTLVQLFDAGLVQRRP